ncbi:hypothetical protein SAMN02745866_03090 [Alteromonadaceae bacterium Bs31]|nr:hypothetical protein SAMN02745866_03090 [Alteromonadaceae bacterium Bs31]
MNYSPLRAITVLFAFALITACGGGGGGSSSGGGSPAGPTSVPSPTSTKVQISGTAAKGIIVGGIVNIHPVSSGAVDFSTTLATTTTDANGAYAIELSGYDGSPIYVNITADNSTTMRCDLAQGCDSAAFGEDLAISEIAGASDATTAFSLAALVPGFSGTTLSSNVSPLTNTAAAFGLAALADNSATSSASMNSIINNANGSVALRFGVLGSLLEIPIIDLTDPAEVAAADDDDLQYNLLATASVAALQANVPDTNIIEALTQFADQYAVNDGLADTEEFDSAAVTLEEILNAAAALVDTLEAEDSSGALDLGALQTEFSAKAGQASKGSTSPTSPIPSTGNASELILVKSMVADIRDSGTALDIAGEGSFADKLETASNTFDAHAGEVMEALDLTLQAISAATDAWLESDEQLSTYAYQGLTVDISTQNGVTTFNHSSNIAIENASGKPTDVAVALNAVLNELERNVIDSQSETGSLESATISINLAVSGTASSSLVDIDIKEGTFQATIESALSEVYGQQSQSNEGNLSETDRSVEEIDITGFELDLLISLAEANGSVQDPLTFTGDFQLSVNNSATASDYNDTLLFDQEQQFVGWVDTWIESATIGEMSMRMGGIFNTASGDSLSASLAINVEGGELSLVCEGEDSYSSQNQTSTNSEICGGETESAYINLDFSLGFDMDITGLEAGSITLTGSRTGLDDGVVEISTNYGDVLLDFQYDSLASADKSEMLTIKNQNGVVLTLIETESEGGNSSSLAGAITVKGTEYATISDELGFIAISYTDGSNESL